ncbi:MAG TPA: ATP-binding protein [Rhizomicrobium sp.]|nr:ATP-binding protein [Rhizomicrobium sp.]
MKVPTQIAKRSGSASDQPDSTPLFLALLGLAVFAATWGCIALIGHVGRISTIWIGNAIVLAALLKRPRGAWFEILGVAFLANFAANVVTGDLVLRGAGLSLANMLEVLIVAWPLRWLGFDRNFGNSEVLLAFYGLAIVACGLSGLAATTVLGLGAGEPLLQAVGTWFGADALGLSLLVPFFMCVKPASFAQMFARGQRLLSCLLIGSVFTAGAICYVFPGLPLSFLYVPAIILLTFRRGFAGGAIGLFSALVISFWLTLSGHSSFILSLYTVSERVAMIQFFFATLGFTTILAGAALEERRKLEQGLSVAVRRAEASREEAVLAKEVAEQASHAKSSFLANMSHELRTPLNAVLGFSEIIHTQMYGPIGDDRYRDYAGLINRAGTHLLDLIGDILDMSKIEAGKLELRREAVDTAALARECAELMAERAASAGVALRSDLVLAPPLVSADRRAIKQILLNLLSNAVKFTPQGGMVTVRVAEDGGECRISIADTGIGMPAGELHRIGNPFVQLSNNSGNHAGTGLGLALVRGLIELHGGTFRIESVEGQGTTVTVLLPLDEPVTREIAA